MCHHGPSERLTIGLIPRPIQTLRPSGPVRPGLEHVSLENAERHCLPCRVQLSPEEVLDEVDGSGALTPFFLEAHGRFLSESRGEQWVLCTECFQ